MRIRQLLIAALLLSAFGCLPSAFACKCAPTRAACQAYVESSVVFSGTVVDTGPTIAKLWAEVGRKLSQKELERLENSHELSLADAKRIWARVLPKEAHGPLRRIRTEEELNRLTMRYFPVLGQWKRPVRFAVDETFKGDHITPREVWTGQGFGDCGYDFQLGERYIVYAYRDDEKNGDQTSICTRTQTLAESTDLPYLRAAVIGEVRPAVSGFVVADFEEFRARTLWWSEEPVRHPVPSLQLELESEHFETVAETDASGRFSFGDVMPGTYVLKATAPHYQFPVCR